MLLKATRIENTLAINVHNMKYGLVGHHVGQVSIKCLLISPCNFRFFTYRTLSLTIRKS